MCSTVNLCWQPTHSGGASLLKIWNKNFSRYGIRGGPILTPDHRGEYYTKHKVSWLKPVNFQTFAQIVNHLNWIITLSTLALMTNALATDQ